MFSRIYIEDVDIVKMYIDECKEWLDELETETLKLEVCPENIDLINNIFTKVHRIKRGSSFSGLSVITRLSYETELLLDCVRNQEVTVDKEFIDSLLTFEDFLYAYISELHEKLYKCTFNNESNLLYLELEIAQNDEEVLLSLKHAYEDCKVMSDENSISDGILSEGTVMDLFQSDEFTLGMTEGIKEQFLYESTEHIEKIENDLLIRLDANSEDKDAVNDIFRAVHSIKGGTGVYLSALSPQSPAHSGIKKFSEVVHSYESLLALIRDIGCQFESRFVNLSFLVIDYLKSYLKALASEEFFDLQNDNILNEIREQISHVHLLADNTMKKMAETQQGQKKIDDKKSKNSMTQSIRVSQEKIDKMMNMISELLIAKNSFLHISSKLNLEYNLPEMSKEVKKVGAYINRISDDLQNTVMSIRMIEVKTVFQKMPRVVRDIAQSTGKKMELCMEGENTELDKTIIEQISDPLVHLVRNAADHGIESPEERISKGKPEIGRIVLRAYNKNKYVYIEIEDDGNGIDTEKLKEKAIEKGFITIADAERMSRNQILNLIFLPGFSTAKQITEISGRGVGMDIVKSNIAELKGNIMLESEAGKGTKVIIQLPLSLAVSYGLIVEASSETYIIPLEYIIETVKINRNNIHKYNGKHFTYLRGDVIRIEWLCELFHTGRPCTGQEELNAVILTNGTENFAIVVDKLKKEQEFVVKTLEGHLASIPGISGSTLLGNGQVVLILNPVDILKLAEQE